MADSAPKPPGLTTTEVEVEIRDMSNAQWQRAELIAGSLCAGREGICSEDVLQEALTKLLGGERVCPRGVPLLVVLENVMRSIVSNIRKHIKNGPVDIYKEVDPLEDSETEAAASNTVASRTVLTPEDVVSSREQLAAVYAELQGDAALEDLAAAWAMGIRGEEAKNELGWSAKEHDAARNRLVRRLKKVDPDRSKQ